MNLMAAYKQVLRDIEELKSRMVILEKPPEVKVADTIKRGPGRPKKVNLDKLVIPVLKRKPGRPRKTDVNRP
jgi:hypothetical protein